jgi:hypothetical protein
VRHSARYGSRPKGWSAGRRGVLSGSRAADNAAYGASGWRALSGENFYASVEYYGTNTERCEAEVNGLKANAFK